MKVKFEFCYSETFFLIIVRQFLNSLEAFHQALGNLSPLISYFGMQILHTLVWKLYILDIITVGLIKGMEVTIDFKELLISYIYLYVFL